MDSNQILDKIFSYFVTGMLTLLVLLVFGFIFILFYFIPFAFLSFIAFITISMLVGWIIVDLFGMDS